MNDMGKIRARIELEDLRLRAAAVADGGSGHVQEVARVLEALTRFVKNGEDLALDDRED